MRKVVAAILLFLCSNLSMGSDSLAQEDTEQRNPRWKIAEDGGITWDVASGDTHQDFIEMSGEQIALLIRYGVDAQGVFTISHSAVWPMLRLHPNRTESHLRVSFGEDAQGSPTNRTDSAQDSRFGLGPAPAVYMRSGDRWAPLTVRNLTRVHHKGITRFEGTLGSVPRFEGALARGVRNGELAFHRVIFPSVDKPAAIDTSTITNTSQTPVEVLVEEFERTLRTAAERGVYGAYTVTERVVGAGKRTLQPGESTTVTLVFEAHKKQDSPLNLDIAAEERARLDRVEALLDTLQLETPDPVLNTAFAFAKVHTAESIFRTKGGLMHAPGGGGGYYAAIWANDQAEYANPFFGLLGDPVASESAINSFRHFARYMNPEYRPIPSSIIAEGDGFWNGAGDRGDMAMIAYGAARFALASGDRQIAEELWPLIEWSLEYLRRKVTAEGVVASDSDELEGRFPAGKANLCTSSLYYDALRSAVMLGKDLRKSRAQLDGYAQRAAAVRTAIERYFGANVEGFDTYRYYDKADLVGHRKPGTAAYATRPDVLRAWISIPLAMGIFDRRDGTIDALFSTRLWADDGLATEAGQITYWDRSTLYALRGVLAAGDTERGMRYLTHYSNRRLLGDHVPYPFEAYPEGGRAQLAAESALYCRVFTEGLFGIRPTGLRSFTVTPRLPEGWSSMALKKIHAFGDTFDLSVVRVNGRRVTVTVIRPGHHKKSFTVEDGSNTAVNMN